MAPLLQWYVRSLGFIVHCGERLQHVIGHREAIRNLWMLTKRIDIEYKEHLRLMLFPLVKIGLLPAASKCKFYYPISRNICNI